MAAAVVGLLALPSVARAEEITVNDDASPDQGSAPCATPDHAAITDAVDAAAAGDTIFVCEGTYEETVDVDKQLTLLGAEADVDARTRDPEDLTGESVITGDVTLGAGGVVLDGFAIASASNVGVAVSGSDQQVVNNIVRESPAGIVATAAGAARIEGNLLTAIEGSALRLDGGNDGVTVEQNAMVDNGFAGVRVRDTGDGDNTDVSVLGNTLAGNDAGINVDAGGLAGALIATGNRIVDNATGIALHDHTAAIAADDNWWGCNEGLPSPDCDSIGGGNADAIDTSQVLRLAIRAPRRIRAGRKRPIRASLVGGDPCQFADHTEIRFMTNLGRLRPPGAATSDCNATTRLKFRRRQRGKATVGVALDNQAEFDVVRVKR